MTAAEMSAVAEAGLLHVKIELVDGRLLAGDAGYVFAPFEARAAARLGIRVRTCLHAALGQIRAGIDLLTSA